jgi:hypothetical protein
MALGDDQRYPRPHVMHDLLEAHRGVTVPKIRGPAAQETEDYSELF